MDVDLAGISIGGGLGNRKVAFVKEAYVSGGITIPGATEESIALFEGGLAPTIDAGLVVLKDASGTEVVADTVVKGIIIL